MTGTERISQAFEEAAAQNRAALMPYLTGGYPDPEAFLRDARTIAAHSDLLEIGLPYSDPLGDGPTIQAAGQAVLAQDITREQVLDLMGEVASLGRPVLAMTYYNPIYRHPGGERGFLEALAGQGVAGVILPDLPPEEAGSLREIARELGLATVFLIAPTTGPDRLASVTAACSGFVYCVSVTGVTGSRSTVSADLPDMLARARQHTDLPLAVGFGVSDQATASRVARHADGVVVGSAIIARQSEPGQLDGFAASLAEGCKRESVAVDDDVGAQL